MDNNFEKQHSTRRSLAAFAWYEASEDANSLKDAFLWLQGCMTYEDPLILDESVVSRDRNSKSYGPAIRAIEQHVKIYGGVVFWKRNDIKSNSISATVQFDQDSVMTLHLSQSEHLPGSILRADFSSTNYVPFGYESDFIKSLEIVLEAAESAGIEGILCQPHNVDGGSSRFAVGSAEMVPFETIEA